MSIRLTDNHQYNMKRKINKKKYAIGGIVQGGANLLSTGINSTVGGSTATTEAEAKSQTASNMLSGAASGASIGMAAGPIGAAVGAVVGAIPGIIGKKGKVTPNGFFEDPSVTYSTGLFRSNKGIKRAYNAAKQRVAGNRIANTQGQDLAQEFDETYDTDVMTLAQGGYSPSLAYVDDGELIQTPDGQVNKVPEKGQPTDSNLVSLPEGSKILSDKVKYPGTKKTFAQVGEEMMTKKKSKNKDRFAENAAKLNEMNNNMIHDQLFAMQESVKQSKGIKPKTKQIQAAALGGTIGRTNSRHKTMSVQGTRYNVGDTFNYKGITYKVTDTNEAIPITAREGYNGPASTGWPTQFNPVSVQSNTQRPMSIVPPGSYGVTSTSTTTPVSVSSTSVKRRRTTPSTSTGLIDEGKPELPFTWYGTVNPLKPKHPELLTATNSEMAGLGDALTSLPKSNAYSKPKPENNKFDWGSALSGIASLAPVISNLTTGDAETVNTNYNPYASTIARTMRRRRFNITPAIEDLNRSRAISNYNASRVNPNTGTNIAFRLQSALGQNRAIADLRAQESNVNNQYAADYASTLNNLGQQYVGATNLSAEQNAQNRAAARNTRRAGLSQLSQWVQNRELMRNQRTRDDAMLDLYKPFLESGYSSDVLQNVYNTYVKGGNRYGR